MLDPEKVAAQNIIRQAPVIFKLEEEETIAERLEKERQYSHDICITQDAAV